MMGITADLRKWPDKLSTLFDDPDGNLGNIQSAVGFAKIVDCTADFWRRPEKLLSSTTLFTDPDENLGNIQSSTLAL